MALKPSQVSSPLPDNPDVRTCGWATNFKPDTPFPSEKPITSVYKLFARSAEKFPNNDCLGHRDNPEAPYKWWTYAHVAQMADALGRAIVSLGLSHGDRMGIYARNSPQWALMQYAAMSQGIVLVPIYDTLGPDIVEYVCNHAEVKLVCVSPDNFPKFKAVLDEGKIPTVANVVIIGNKDVLPEAERDACKVADNITTIDAFLNTGKDLQTEETHSPPDVSLSDRLVIMYTSGTTGDPKGVVLTHGNFIASVSSAYTFFIHWEIPFQSTDRLLSFLPLSHIFEQQAEALMLGCGASVGYFSGDIKILLSDMQALRPTFFAGVPRVFARFQQRIEENVESASFIQRTLFNWAYARQLRAEENPGVVLRSALWDALVFKKVRAKLLPDARIILTGSAPMSPQTNDFLKVCLQSPVAQGYGLTETVGGMTVSVPGLSKSGSVGGPLPGSLIKLADLPEMGYLSSDKPFPRGEICIKGDIVTSGYYKNEEATAAAFDEDGYFKTGDVGQWLADGSLQIIDRAKNLFKLSQGEYVSPDILEQEYGKAKLVGQIYVYGNSLQSTLVAVVVPDLPAADAWGTRHRLMSLESIVSAPAFKKDVIEQLEELRVEAKFKKYEKIVDVIFEITGLNDLGQGFHVDNDLMTPSFKLRRPQLRDRYKDALDKLYEA